MIENMKKVLLIDNYDSFTYNVYQYLGEIGAKTYVILNDELSEDELNHNIKKWEISHILISPGPKRPQDAGISKYVIEKYKGLIPIFGICLGYQCINEVYGGKLLKGNPIHGIVEKMDNIGGGLYVALPKEFMVTRYHSLNIDPMTLNGELTVDGRLGDGTIMSIRNIQDKIYGVQYHPEAIMSEHGHQIFRNFLEIK